MGRAGKITLYVVYFAIVVALGGFIIHSARSNSPAKPKKSTTSQHQQSASSTKPKVAAKSNTAFAGSAVAQTGSSSSTPASTAGSNQGSLANTGPGNVFGLFTGTSLLGALIYRRRLVARAK